MLPHGVQAMQSLKSLVPLRIDCARQCAREHLEPTPNHPRQPTKQKETPWNH